MRKLLAVAVISTLLLALVPQAAWAGDPHAVRNRWTGVGIGAAAVTLGGLILGSLFQPAPVVAAPPAAVAPPPPVVYSPPPVVYAPPPVVVYSAPPPPVVYAPPAVVVAPSPPVVYAPAPVVVYRGWGPPGHWQHGSYWHR